MIVKVHCHTQSQPVLLENVHNCYQKGDFYCVMQTDGTVRKFPIQNIWCVTEIGARESDSIESRKEKE